MCSTEAWFLTELHKMTRGGIPWVLVCSIDLFSLPRQYHMVGWPCGVSWPLELYHTHAFPCLPNTMLPPRAPLTVGAL